MTRLAVLRLREVVWFELPGLVFEHLFFGFLIVCRRAVFVYVAGFVGYMGPAGWLLTIGWLSSPPSYASSESVCR